MTACRLFKLLLVLLLLPLSVVASAQERITKGFILRVPMPPPGPFPGQDGPARPALIEHGLSISRQGGPMDKPGRAGLLLECRKGALELLALDLDWPPDAKSVGEVDVMVQLDQAASPERWRILGNAYAPPDPAALFERFLSARTFALQVQTPAGERELSFDLQGFSEAAVTIRAACPF